MRKYLLSALTLVAATAQAAPVGRTAAMELARRFVGDRFTQTAFRHNLRAAQTGASKALAAEPYYVFNIDDGGGFVIVSGDDRTQPILGYTGHGTFDAARLPGNMRLWLAGMADEVMLLQRSDEDGAAGARRRAEALVSTKEYVPTLIATSWNQDYPYNKYCPEGCVTGCVATAMAQVMKYHEWPRGELQKAIPGGYAVRNAEAGNTVNAGTVFNWTQMNTYYNNNERINDGSEEAVAMLMLACGVSVEMQYGPGSTGGSSATLNSAASALTTYFNYGSTVKYVSRADYEYDPWLTLIYKEVADGRPVLYGGQSSGGGHAFVIDGYDGAGLFHVNWGWGGDSDGYFALSVLNPYNTSGIGSGGTKDGYAISQDAVIGIWPDDPDRPYTGETAAEPVADVVQMTTASVSVSGTTISSAIWNMTGSAQTFSLGYGYVRDDGTVEHLWTYHTFNDLGNNSGLSALTLDVGSLNLADGTYKIVPVSKTPSDDAWHTSLDVRKQYVLATVVNGTVTLTDHYNNIRTVTLKDARVVGRAIAGQTFEVVCDIESSGDEFYGSLNVIWTSGSSNYNVGATGITIREGETRPVSFWIQGLDAGDYTLGLWITESGSLIEKLGDINVTVTTPAITASSLAVTDLAYDNSNAGHEIYGSAIKGHVTMKNSHATETFEGNVTLQWYYRQSNSSSGSFPLHHRDDIAVSIAPNATVDIPFEVTGLESGYDYWPTVIVQGADLRNNYADVCTLLSGITACYADGSTISLSVAPDINLDENVTSVDLSSVSGVRSVNPANPNTLFYIGDAAEMPAGTTNIVRGGVCEELVLEDGYPFAPRVAFTARKVTYKRTFATGYGRNGGGWTTVVLPFSVGSVKAEFQGQYYPIDWFRTDVDTGKHFWVMGFAYEEGGVVNFGHAREMKADTPYIIAVPNGEWGSGADLTSTPMLFEGADAYVNPAARPMVMGQRFRMSGTYIPATPADDFYKLDYQGAAFVRSTGATEPFRAYFLSNEGLYYDVMNIGLVGGTANAIGTLPLPADGVSPDADVYDLSGRRVGTMRQSQRLGRGIYVVGGKKVKL
jgi:hypothetical protein